MNHLHFRGKALPYFERLITWSLPLLLSPFDQEIFVKKLAVLAICCAFLFSSPLSGQISLGFQGGLSLATVGGSDLDDLDAGYRKGIGLGVFLELPVSDLLSIQPEILYLQKGTQESEQDVDYTFALDYVEIPVLLRINIPVEGTVAPYFLVGPALGFKAGCEVSGEDDEVELNVDCDEAEIEIKSLDLGAVIGAGLSFEAGPGDFHLGARYNYGLTILDDSGEDDDIKSRAFSFLVGYSFPMGG